MHVRTIGAAGAILLAVMLGGCPTTRPADTVERRGFLGDYSRLEPGRSGQVLERWVEPDADWSAYSAVFIEPVEIWAAPDTGLMELTDQERKVLVDYLHAAMARELGPVLQVVDRPGDGTIRLRLALTGAESSSAALDTVSTALPLGQASSGLRSLAPGRAAFVAATSVEAELRDARTGIVLAQAVDARVGGKSFSGATSSWSDAQEACDYWAGRLAAFVREQRTDAGK